MNGGKKEAKNMQSFKVVLMGDSGVGKTSIVNRYTKGTFDNSILSTAGVCFSSKMLDFPDLKETCKLDVKKFNIIYYIIQIWDTAGQERYKSITKIYYQKSDAILFVYDITKKSSFDNLKVLYNEVKEAIDVSKILVCVVGNKNDQYMNEEVPKEKAEEYAKSIKGLYRCVSALDTNSGGISELFETVGKELFENQGRETCTNEENIKIEKKDNTGGGNQKGKSNKERGCCQTIIIIYYVVFIIYIIYFISEMKYIN